MFVNWNKVRSALDKSGGSRWYVVGARLFTNKEKNPISSVEVIKSEFGLAMAFHISDKDIKYIPVDINSSFKLGDHPSIDDVMILTLFRSYSDGYIYRVTNVNPDYLNTGFKKGLLKLWFRENIGAYIYHKLCIPLKKLDYKIHHKRYNVFEDLYLY